MACSLQALGMGQPTATFGHVSNGGVATSPLQGQQRAGQASDGGPTISSYDYRTAAPVEQQFVLRRRRALTLRADGLQGPCDGLERNQTPPLPNHAL